MDISESENILRKIYYAYIREPLMKIKERWLAYFAEFMIDEGPPTPDAESEIYSSMEVLPKKMWQNNGGTREKSEFPLSRFNLIITALGTTLGLGYLWRVPTRTLQYRTGGAYLVMYVLSMITLGYVVYFIQLGMGQYSSSTAITLFRKVPLAQGVGYSLLIFTYIVTLHYSYFITSGAFFFASSFTFNLPWSQCPDGKMLELNITKCGKSSEEISLKCPKRTITLNAARLCRDYSYYRNMESSCCKDTSHCKIDKRRLCFFWTFPAAYFSYTKFERFYDSDHPLWKRLGPANLKFLLYFGAVWFLTFIFSTIKLKWARIMSMIAHPCLIACYLVLLSVSLRGKETSVALYALFVPNVNDLIDPTLWARAVNDAMHTLGLATTFVYFLGSVSRFKSPCHLDIIPIIFFSLLTTVLAVTVLFPEAARVSKKINDPITGQEYSFGDKGWFLFFMGILSRLPIPWLCTIVFLFFFLIAGIVALAGLIVSMSVTMCDAARINVKDKHIVNFLLTFSFFLVSIVYIFDNGTQVHQLMTYTIIKIGCISVVAGELLMLNVYGVGLFCEDMAFMLGFYPNRLFRYTFMLSAFVLIPITISWLFIFYWNKNWGIMTPLGYILPGVTVAPTILGMLFALIKYTFKLDLKGIVRVSPSQGPKNEELKMQREEFRTRRRIF